MRLMKEKLEKCAVKTPGHPFIVFIAYISQLKFPELVQRPSYEGEVVLNAFALKLLMELASSPRLKRSRI